MATVLLLVTVALSWSISRSLVTRLRSVVTVMRRAADGDLSARLDVDGPDEIAS
ncbi:HAMP domain-containing protein [Couchioplanes azureus]|uniref:HAMP domain-containing protein n=1 Tax=Couchioplanes caeruleus TaxID=56438 RepID=UPI001670406A|nr:HAMP domain-containing protein [Couchioplanes caeruleus]